MRDRIWIYSIIATFFGLLINTSCENEDSKTVKQQIRGHVQKGPYIVGTSISMSELKPSLDQTGKTFTTQISENSGFFEFTNVGVTSTYVEFSANGFYFDEVKGSISLAPLTLYSLSDVTSMTTANVNILTHLETLRVEFLVKQNKSFSEAKRIAQSEVLAIFGIDSNKVNSSELLDISHDNEGNAILLAISVIVQGNRTVGDLSELLANISNDIREDGILNSESVRDNLRNSAKGLTLATIRSNLEKRYQELGTNATIPSFESYVSSFLAFGGQKPTASTQQATSVETASVTLNATVNANSLSTNVSFEYGITANYGQTISAIQSVTGFSDVNVTAGLTGLTPGLVYHFRVKAENSKGITYGEDLVFSTLGQVPTVTTSAATSVVSNSAVLNGIVNANHLPTTVTFDYGTTTTYGQTVTAMQSPVNGSLNTSISLEITGLTTGTTYHFRVTATNELGSVSGEDYVFTAGYNVGGRELGGIVAYILQPGDPGYIPGETHGLVVAATNQSEGVQWYNGTYLATGATATALGSGYANTAAIISSQGDTGAYAAKLCRDYAGGGFTDWYLPSKDELNKVYQNRFLIGGLSTNLFYWSSTEFDTQGACYHDFGNNMQFCGFWKYNIGKVRAVRSF